MNKKEFEALNKTIMQIENKHEREIAQAYLQFAKDTKMDISDVFEQLATDGVVDRADFFKFKRSEKFFERLSERVKALILTVIKIIKKSVSSVFQESYYRNAHSIELKANSPIFSLLSKDVIEAHMQNDMTLIKWEDNMKANANELIKHTKEVINTGLVQGLAYAEIAKNLSEKIDINRNKALTITRTESHRAREEGNMMAMQRAKDKGVIMKKRWLATLDSRTRKTHQHLDGQTIDIDDYFVSRSGNRAKMPCKFGDPKEDISCRCTILSIFEGFEPTVRRARDEANKGEIITYKNYNEWKQNLK